ncbi:ribosome silencing factor [Candidatus Gracilibacteria bacterium]|jgi:ribosome-associated protein|nr:ribosome silencing factor [Candidatus Gracilibacteria bacterium]NJM86652.1 ribosome silencing factor [Hydrococcus sp. RU_2_2]
MTNRNLQQDRSTQIAENNNSEQMTRQFVETIAQAADDRKAGDLVILKVTDVSYLSDYFVIATGFSRAQVRAISDAIEEKIAKEYGRNPLRTEGKMEGNWVLHDYGDVIVHIFLPQEREFYNLEAFWGHAERMDLSLYNSVRE